MTETAERIPVGVSSCLLGEAVRYDGGHKHDRYVTGVLGRYFEYIAMQHYLEPYPDDPGLRNYL